jgi:hypothetical protein
VKTPHVTLTIASPPRWVALSVPSTSRLTSPKAPNGATAVVFLEVDRAKLDRHIATHLTEEEAAA